MRVRRTASVLLCLLWGAHALGQEGARGTPTEEEGGRLFDAFGWAMTASAGTDLASTEWGLTRSHLAEMNPLMKNRGVRVGVHVATPVAVWWVTDRMRRDGHPKLALFVRIGVTAVYGYATAHNLRTLTRQPR